MDDKSIELIKTLVDSTVSNYFWWFLLAGTALFFKSLVESVVTGMMFYWGRDYNVDDEVYLSGSRKARIVRQTISKTVFYLHDTNTRLVVLNRNLPNMQIETVLRSDVKE